MTAYGVADLIATDGVAPPGDPVAAVDPGPAGDANAPGESSPPADPRPIGDPNPPGSYAFTGEVASDQVELGDVVTATGHVARTGPDVQGVIRLTLGQAGGYSVRASCGTYGTPITIAADSATDCSQDLLPTRSAPTR